MRYTHPLDDLLSSQARLRSLRCLCTAGGEHTGREIARAIEMGETPTRRALKELADKLVVLDRVAGCAHYYRLNEPHALVGRVLNPWSQPKEPSEMPPSPNCWLARMFPWTQCWSTAAWSEGRTSGAPTWTFCW